jgi:hypothetical protein
MMPNIVVDPVIAHEDKFIDGRACRCLFSEGMTIYKRLDAVLRKVKFSMFMIIVISGVFRGAIVPWPPLWLMGKFFEGLEDRWKDRWKGGWPPFGRI